MSAATSDRAPGVLVLYNDDGALAGGSQADRIAVEAVVGMAESIAAACRARGRAAAACACPRDPAQLLALLRERAPDLVFHCVESLDGDPRFEAAVASLYELAGVAYTGTPPTSIALGLDKPLCKALLRSRGVPTPDWIVLERADEALDFTRAGAPPWIVKPAREDASHGITRDSIAHDEARARALAGELIHRYDQPALVEQYIEGRELNIAILGAGASAEALPLAEIDFSGLPAGHPRILTYEAKWDEASPVYVGSPSVAARLAPAEESAVRAVALAAYRVSGLRDYGRVDLRLCPKRGPLVMEVNPNPDLSPGAGFAKAAARAGLAYEDLIERIASLALARAAPHAHAPAHAPAQAHMDSHTDGHANAAARATSIAAPAERAAPTARLRELRASDRGAIEQLLRGTSAFSEPEIEVALELVDAGLAPQGEDPYEFLVAEDERGAVVGYACFGRRPGLRGDWDLYWIAVDAAQHGSGIGRRLLSAVEDAARAAGGARLIAETASKPSYAKTRAFYERAGYSVASRVLDHYAPGDDMLVYARALR
jgi:D-alanine-D-alanine ligase